MLFSNTVEGQTNCLCETSSEYPLQLLQLVLILIIFFLLSILFCVLLTDYLRADSDEAPVDDQLDNKRKRVKHMTTQTNLLTGSIYKERLLNQLIEEEEPNNSGDSLLQIAPSVAQPLPTLTSFKYF